MMLTTSAAEGIFDTMMSIRTHLAIHGEEYLPFWNHMLKEPFSNGTDIYNDVISFSDFFGRPTANLYAQATPEEVLEPLKPRLIDGKRNRLVNIIVYLCETGIAGIKLTFESQDIYDLGTYTKKSDGFDLRDTYIDRLIAFGEGKIDGLKFILDDGRNLMFGEVTSSSFETFELPDHHIASLYLASDTRDLDGNAANIAVSYQWKNK
ncbi:hypothetical protein JTB14_000127 [Gonioctena quinquepunctata]|nr:hypothetical protein JTB14_000127 [Gonioctena quinquepunctata]